MVLEATLFLPVNINCNFTVHGGIGEDGTLQSLLEAAGVPYTGQAL